MAPAYMLWLPARPQVGVTIFDHPENPGYPAYWHARGYGLFAANPLGAAALTDGADVLNLTLAPGASATFQYRVVIEQVHSLGLTRICTTWPVF